MVEFCVTTDGKEFLQTEAEELLEQLAEDFKTEIIAHMSTLDTVDADPCELIRELCAAYWRGCRDHSAELAAMFQAAMLDEHFRLRWQEIRADARSEISAAIVAAEKTGLVTAPNPNPEAMASAIGSMMNYFCYIWLIDGGEPGCPMLSDEVAIDTMARVFYRSVFAAPERGGE
jgi:AcrR family transcriptional regulator